MRNARALLRWSRDSITGWMRRTFVVTLSIVALAHLAHNGAHDVRHLVDEAVLGLVVVAVMAVAAVSARRRTRSSRVILRYRRGFARRVAIAALAGSTGLAALAALPAPPPPVVSPAEAALQAAANGECNRDIYADVVAIDQIIVYNRLGATNPNGLMYALRRDVVNKNNGLSEAEGGVLAPGEVMLRPDKRPRPLVLRANVGDCITVGFENLLDPAPPGEACPPEVVAPDSWDDQPHGDWPCDRHVGMHVNDMQLVDDIASNGNFVGKNSLDEFGNPIDKSGIVAPGESIQYKWFAEYENTFLLYNQAVTVGSEGSGGTAGLGLFGAVNVEPVTSVWYRSQLTRQEMDWAATVGGTIQLTPGGQPIIDYDAVYPAAAGPAKAGLPIIAMLAPKAGFAGELVHSDINAIISGPESNGYKIPTEAYTPGYWENANYPGGDEPFREYTVIFHDEAFGVQAFPQFTDPAFEHALHGVADAFPVNYGSGGIGAEIIANRLGLGPMANCVECKYEEFFLTSWAVGDPAMIVDTPASANVDTNGSVVENPVRATKALYPDDPSNVHHSYLNDRVKFRNLHAGPKEHHIFHLHAHQWQFDWNDQGSNYLDSQGMGPGSGFTYEIAYGGSGNRNKTAGDSIFHCHFYPHFAQGMWELWRVHDTFERGTLLDGEGKPAAGSRALPDGEIVDGTPIPGVVPLPALPMAPSPAVIDTLVTGWDNPDDPNDIPTSQIDLDGDNVPDVIDTDGTTGTSAADNPGYPFFIPALTGHRPPTPTMDIVDDGGLQRHIITTAPGAIGDTHEQWQTPVDFNKIVENAGYGVVPEAGTATEQAAMAFHAARWHATYLPDGTPVNEDNTVSRRIGEDGDVGPQGAEPSINLQGFETNGLAPQPGAPYADPCRTDPAPVSGDIALVDKTRRYKGANIEMDVVLNKVGWHFQQQRFEALWEDVDPILSGDKAPEPLVMRLNPTECAEFLHTNLVPNVYQLDDYQVRTPTDVIGQHIHLVKFDVMSADGSANGWNYEDGTLSPQEVEERIHAIHEHNGCDPDGGVRYRLDADDTQSVECPLAVKHPFFKDSALVGDLAWGARTTVQRWYADPLLERSWDGGVGTVFTHDHYGPSTHQQVGLYSTVLIEPVASQWRDPETGDMFGGVLDGDTLKAPTGWVNSDQGLKRLAATTGPALARQDGGPTSWRADILVPDWQPTTQDGDPVGSFDVFEENSHREFFMEFADFQHAYEAGRGEFLGDTDENGEIDIGEGCDAKDPLHPGRRIPCYADFFGSVNPSIRQEPPEERITDLVFFPSECDDGSPRPCPEAISADDPGTYVINYRNEPLGLRIFEDANLNAELDVGDDLNCNGIQDGTETDGGDGVFDPCEDTDGDGALGQTAGDAGDLARAFQSRTDRAIPQLNTPYGDLPWPAPPGVKAGDPATPLLRTYAGDKARVRIQTGAHEEEHNMMIHGLKWRREFDSANSGWRNSQFMGISEYFNLEMPVVPNIGPGNPQELDYLWTAGAHRDDLWNGVWGILRSYASERGDLLPLPNNPIGDGLEIDNINQFKTEGQGQNRQPTVCPKSAPERFFRVTAVRADQAIGPDGIVYNTRPTNISGQGVGPLIDPTALIYVLNDDLDSDGKLKAGVPIEPLVLRANAGDCIKVELTNALPADPVLDAGGANIGFEGQDDLPGFGSVPSIVTKDKDVVHNGVVGMTTLNANDLAPSSYVGLHTQLVAYNVRDADGFVTGGNSDAQLVPPGEKKAYTWYAGDIHVDNHGDGSVSLVPTPVEFGVVNLMPADRIKGSAKGLVGALVIEPPEATWIVDQDSRLSATVTHTWADGTTTSFREFIVLLQNDINLRYSECVEDPLNGGSPGEFAIPALMQCAVPNIAAEGPGTPEDPQDGAQKAINYGAEPMWFRLGIPPNTGFSDNALRDNLDNHKLYSNSMPGVGEDPQTAVFTVSAVPTAVDVDGDGENDAMQFRMRVVMPGGNARGIVWTINGHAWQQAPYVNASAAIGDDFRTHDPLNLSNPAAHQAGAHNMQTWWVGSQEGIGAGSHFDFVPRKTGGKFAVTGDYLFRDIGSFGNYQGLWGILRFEMPPPVVGDPPDAVDDTFDVRAWTRRNPRTTTIDAPGVLGNDNDPDGDPMTAVLVTQATHGDVTLNPDGSFSYTTTTQNHVGQDSFTYKVVATNGLEDVATVTLNVS